MAATLHIPLNREQDPEILKHLCFWQEERPFSQMGGSTVYWQRPIADNVVADPHSDSFTLSYKLPQCVLEVLEQRSQLKSIICRKQRRNSAVPKPDTVLTLIFCQ